MEVGYSSMIFVTLGTQDKQFPRLLQAFEDFLSENKIADEIIVQAGHTKFVSQHMQVFDFMSQDEFTKALKNADVIVTHGGVGTIMTALKYQKKILAVARLQQYHEHQNDHQLELLEAFAQKGYLIHMTDFSRIPDYLEQIRCFQPKSYVSNTDHMVKMIQTWIDENV